MQTLRFSYADAFACLAGACPDTCCRDWEIDLDEAARARYLAAPGELGQALRRAMDAGGGECFQLQGGFCPFLNEEGLCRIQKAWGPEALTVNCDSFPRFYEVYGASEELSLSPACPEAARLLLEADAVELISTQDERLPEPNDLDALLVIGLRALRAKALALLAEDKPLAEKLGRLLAFAKVAQARLDAEDQSALRSLQIPEKKEPIAVDDNRLFLLYDNLDLLREDSISLLHQPVTGAGDVRCAARYAQYHLFRWLMKASEDGRILPRVRGAIWGALCLARMTAGGAESVTALYRYCREVDHCPENLAAVQNAAL